jgi:prevent-host-death family protein
MTRVIGGGFMEQSVSKSAFKAKALEYFREVESTGKKLVITDHGKPVLKVVPYAHDPAEALRSLRGTVLRFTDPLEPVGLDD